MEVVAVVICSDELGAAISSAEVKHSPRHHRGFLGQTGTRRLLAFAFYPINAVKDDVGSAEIYMHSEKSKLVRLIESWPAPLRFRT